MSPEEKDLNGIFVEEENENDEEQVSATESDEFDEFVKALDERIDTLLRPVDQDAEVAIQDVTDSKPEPAEEKMLQEEPQPSEEEVNLNELIEKMHIAYLALEWEFSRPNLEKLESAITDIEKSVKLNDHAARVSKVLDGLIQLFYKGENFVTLKSMKLLKDAIQCFARTVKKDSISQDHELIKSVETLERGFQSFVSEMVPTKPERAVIEERTEAVPEGELVAIEPGPVAEEAVLPHETAVPADISPVMESLENISEGIEKTTATLKRLCTTLAKKPSLKPLNDYLMKVERNYSLYLGQLKDLKGQLALVLGTDHGKLIRAERLIQDEYEPGQLSTVHKEQSRPVVYKGDEIPPDYRNVFLAQIMGLYYFLPAPPVVRIAHASRKKMETILSRGYATLKDFKPFLRNVKTYLIGRWNELSVEELKALRFRPVDVGRPLGIGNTLQAVGGDAILLSFNYGNFIIFVDAVLSREPLEIESLEVHPDETRIAGYASAGGRKGVPVLSGELFKECM